MSTFNPGTNEPTPEQGSAPEGEERPSENPQVDEVPKRDLSKDYTHYDTEDTGPLTTYETGHGRNPGKHEPEGDDPDQVPDTVADVKAWLDEAPTPAERARRANLAERAEEARGGDNRQGIQKAIDEARRAR